MSDTKTFAAIDARVIALNRTLNYLIDEKHRPYIARIEEVYLYDKNERTHCCDDRLVRVASASSLAQFGPLAAAAVPLLEPWLEDENEYIKVIAASTILALDPTQSVSLLPKVKEGLYSKNPVVRSLAEEFFEKRPAKITESAKQKIAGLGPTERVRLALILNDVHLWPQEERRLHDLGCRFFVQTSFVATVEVPVERVEDVAKLPSVREIR